MGVAGQAAGSGSSAAAAPAAQPQDQQQPQPSTLSGALGGALAGRFGLGRKKQTAQDQNASGTGSSSGSLLDMTIEMSGFSASPVDPALFEVPAGFKHVEPDSRRIR